MVKTLKPDSDDPITEALRRYAELAPQPDWIPSAALRANVRNRRRVRIETGVAVVAIGLTSALVLALASWPVNRAHGHDSAVPTTARKSAPRLGELESNVKRQAPTSSAPSRQVALDEQVFAFDLLQALAQSSGPSNVVASPMGLDEALSMLEMGAAGSTREELAGATDSKTLSATEQAEGWNSLTRQLKSDAAGAVLELRNGLIVEDGLVVKPQFLNDIMRNFGAGIRTADFNQPAEAQAAISAWLRQALGSSAPSMFPPGSLTPKTVAALVNALGFRANWASDVLFSKAPPTEDVFHIGGTTVPTQMMDARLELFHSLTPQYSAVVLPYQAADMEAVAIEPSAGTSMASLLKMLSPALLSGLDHDSDTTVDLTMPAFSIGWSGSLNAELRQLGMGAAFSSAADFAGLANSQVQIEDAAETSVLEVDASGTGTDSSTGIASGLGAAHGGIATISFDRPFVWLVRDKRTGLIVSEAIVADPRASP
jgi:serine protease inhibitor